MPSLVSSLIAGEEFSLDFNMIASESFSRCVSDRTKDLNKDDSSLELKPSPGEV